MSSIESVEQLEALYGLPRPEVLDCSPRGDRNGFVRIADALALLMADRRGNNRVDSLRNIVRDPPVGLLFLVPGVGNTLRVNGRARLSVDAERPSGWRAIRPRLGRAREEVDVVR